jgi:hypothetical protein
VLGAARKLVKKASMVTAGLISCDAEALRSLVVGRRMPKNGKQIQGLAQFS